MKDRDFHLVLQALFNDETLWRLDVLQVDSAECRLHQLDRIHDRVHVLGVQFDVDRIHIGEPLEQNGLAFHHRLGRQGAKISKAQYGCAIGDHRDQIALGSIVISRLRRRRDSLTRDGHTRRIGQAQIPLSRHRNGRRNLQLAGRRLQMELQGILRCDPVAAARH